MATRNICPRAHGEGGLGKDGTRWGDVQTNAVNGKNVTGSPVVLMSDLERTGRPNLVVNAALENWLGGTEATPAGCTFSQGTVSRQTESEGTFARMVTDGSGNAVAFAMDFADWVPAFLNREGGTLTIAVDVRTTSDQVFSLLGGGYHGTQYHSGDGGWETLRATVTYAPGGAASMGSQLLAYVQAAGNATPLTVDIRNPRVALGDTLPPAALEGGNLYGPVATYPIPGLRPLCSTACASNAGISKPPCPPTAPTR